MKVWTEEMDGKLLRTVLLYESYRHKIRTNGAAFGIISIKYIFLYQWFLFEVNKKVNEVIGNDATFCEQTHAQLKKPNF